MEKIDSKYVKTCKYVALQCLDHCVDFKALFRKISSKYCKHGRTKKQLRKKK